MKAYNKLVRDRIPEIIEANGEKPVIEILDDADLLDALIAKLYEEADEIKADPCVEELADLEEVILAIAKRIGVTPQELAKVRKRKSKKRGAFDEGIFLKGVE